MSEVENVSFENRIDQALELELEYRLTIAIRLSGGDGCNCVEYLMVRRNVLIPAILEEAERQKKDSADVFAAFARRLHAKHEDENAS